MTRRKIRHTAPPPRTLPVAATPPAGPSNAPQLAACPTHEPSSVVLRLLRSVPPEPLRPPETDLAPDADDVALVTRLALDDGQALAALMDRYWRPMVAFALDKARSRDAAEDLVQEAFVRVWERRRQLRPHASPRAYLYRVLRNLITDEFRRRRLRERFRFFLGQRDAAEAPSAAAALEAGELATAADRAIAALPERRRDVFILAHLHGLSYREVAETLGITPRTVANHMSLALAQLREALADFTGPSRAAGGSARTLVLPPPDDHAELRER